MGKDYPRVDIPAKVTGAEAYVQDLRLPGMLHARVVRGPSYGTRLTNPPLDTVRAMPGVVTVIENGSFIAVVARKEWQAIQAMRVAQEAGFVRENPPLPVGIGSRRLLSLPSREIIVLDTHDGPKPSVRTVRGEFSRPWYSHGSIGPSCAVALARDGELTLWSHSQGVFDMHRAVAQLVGLPPEKVRCIHSPSAGCYGQNGADDVTAEAGIIAMALPGHPIRLQWMREQEFGWEPCGCGMVTRVEASIGPDRRIAHWTYEVWSNSHNNRPVKAGGHAVAQQVDPPFPCRRPSRSPCPRATATGTPTRSMSSTIWTCAIISSPTCRCVSRRCGRWARISTSSHWKACSMIWLSRPAPIRSISVWPICRMNARAPS
jgi:CO/xanthine dehydrogenase Mo-binding subunit